MDPLTQLLTQLVDQLVVAAAKAAADAIIHELKQDGTAVQALRDPDFNRRVGARIDEWMRGQGGLGGRDGAHPPG